MAGKLSLVRSIARAILGTDSASRTDGAHEMSPSQRHSLPEHPFLDDLDGSTLAVIVDCATHRHYPAGDYVIRQGGLADHCFLVLGGLVNVETWLPNGRKINIQTLGDGEVLGWDWLVPPYEWHFDGRAAREVSLISLDAIVLRKLCETDRQLGYEIFHRFLPVIARTVNGQHHALKELAMQEGPRQTRLNG